MDREPNIAALREAVVAWEPRKGRRPTLFDAAVAAVLRERDGVVEILFIRRAKHPRDPWSGQMGWPGGRLDPEDRDAKATAIRETREELGLDLEEDAIAWGRLSTARTHLLPGVKPRGVVPFVFELRGNPPLTPNGEVAEALFIPISFFLDSKNRSSMIWSRLGPATVLPCYRYQDRVIWGLTLRMLDELLEPFAR